MCSGESVTYVSELSYRIPSPTNHPFCFSALSINWPPLRGLNRARALARRIKAHLAYTGARDVPRSVLGIVGADDATDLTTSQPDITGDDRTGGQVEICFNKLTSDGVNIYSKRDGDVDFIFLARDTQTPYLDNRPLKVAGKPEIREYKAMFVVGDQEIGIFSHELVVNCAP